MNSETLDYADLELSTRILIKEALKRGVEVEVLDRKDNFIALRKGNKTEYVKQATMTSADRYISALIMENKFVTKQILEKNGIRTPKGEIYSDIESAGRGLNVFRNLNVVVKPNSTNFGVGVSIVKKDRLEYDYKKALEKAFQYDDSVLVEEFVQGKEYRFLIIGDKVAGVLCRVPANVEGDGESDIERLVIEKNKNCLRGAGYKKPLEKIKLGEVERDFLALQGKTFRTVPKKGTTVFLRENSNISSGGDSHDYTDDISHFYKELALKSTRAAGAKICGADIVIQDIHVPPQKDNYAVIELNFNPAIHMHNHPYKGKNRRVDKEILDLLGF